MKKIVFLFGPIIMLLFSCVHEVEKSHLIEYKINNQYYSFTGYAIRYTCYAGQVKKGFLWKFYNSGDKAINIQIYDTTFVKNIYEFPSFKVTYVDKSGTGGSKTYKEAAGEIRLLGFQARDITGDFNFKLKNMVNSNDSISLNEGYFRIYIDLLDSVISK